MLTDINSEISPANELGRRAGTTFCNDWLEFAVEQFRDQFEWINGDYTARAQILWETFLNWDVNCGPVVDAKLPDISEWHNRNLDGRYVLQLEHIMNIAAPVKDRFSARNCKRCLKLHLSDGERTVVGFEYRHIEALAFDTPIGTKVAITNAPVKNGLLFLCPENVEILGGQVQHLADSQRQFMEQATRPAGPQ